METQEFNISLPSEILNLCSATDLTNDARFLFATKLYLEEKISIGKAANLAGFNRWEYETKLSKLKIPISLLEYEDIEKELKSLI